MEITNIIEHKDGSATFDFTGTEEELNSLFAEGLNDIIPQKYKGKMVAVPYDGYFKKIKPKHILEIDDETYREIVASTVVKRIKNAIKKEKKSNAKAHLVEK